MKCPSCNAVNKKTDLICKKCKNPLQANIKETKDVKEEVIAVNEEKTIIDPELRETIKQEIMGSISSDINELKEDLTMNIKDLKEDIAKEFVKEKNSQIKKKKNFIYKLITFFKVLIILSIISLLSLIVYVYSFYDYEKYYTDAVTRYYETENNQYIDNIKLFFRVYKYTDSKISKAQNIGANLINNWIVETKSKEYDKEEDFIAQKNNLSNIIESLYNNTEVNGHRAINKKDYLEITKNLEYMTYNNSNKQGLEETENKEKEEKDENKEYDISKMRKVNVKGAYNLFKQPNSTYILYIGRESCDACKEHLPVLNKVVQKNNITVQYLDISEVNDNDEYYDEFIKLLDKKVTLTINKTATEKTLGEYMGYTPMTVIIENGKNVDGVIGTMTTKEVEELISKYFKK